MISLSFRICRLSKIDPDGAITSLSVMILMIFLKIKMGSNRPCTVKLIHQFPILPVAELLKTC